jgi:hypothetical protein
MAPTRPAGPRPLLVLGALGGSVLVAWAVMAPSLNIIWQVPLGIVLAVSCIGRMSSR